MKTIGKITDEEIERARNVRISDIIGVENRRQNICCPFPNHNDSTPSFLLDQDNGYHCFGCGKHGNNAIDFCLELDQSSNFVDAVEFLCSNY
jgi:DNA primase